jgi:hypothetical protein
MSCTGSMYCDACGGVCFTDTISDPQPYEEGLLDTGAEPTFFVCSTSDIDESGGVAALEGTDVPPLVPPQPPEPTEVPLIPPRLAQRMREYGIELPPFAPIYDRVFVYPTDDNDQPEKVGELYIAQSTKNRLGAMRGVLIMAGPRAIEQLYSHGIGVGDMVLCARFSTWDRAYVGAKRDRVHRMMVLRAAEIVGGEDLLTDIQGGALRMVMTPDGTVQWNDRRRIDPPENDEGI